MDFLSALTGEFLPERVNVFRWLCWERYQIKLRKDAGEPRPWTADPVLNKYHFCNVFRWMDRTSLVIHDIIRAEAPDGERMLQAAILGRVVNKAETIPGAWQLRHDEPWALASYLRERGVNTNAYRQNTPMGLNSIDGIEQMALVATRDWWRAVDRATTLQQAHQLITSHSRIGRFVSYQIALDLYDCDFWVDGFDSDWTLAGPGALRGCLYLLGRDVNRDWTASEFRKEVTWDLQARLLPMMRDLTHHIAATWPREWPAFTIHETEFMLCELDKWLRKREATKPTGRVYRARGLS